MARTLLSRAHPTRMLALALASAVLVASGIVWASAGGAGTPVVRTEQMVLDGARMPASTGRVRLDATLYTPDTTPAPAVLLPHGFGGGKDSVSGQARELAERGFTVLTYSARGFGHSTGTISLNDPDFEVADAQRLIDYLGGRPQVLTDAAGDPQVGVLGASYGGALALLLAGRDYRVDAIVPVMTYNDLAQGLVPNAATTDRIGADTPAAGAFAPDGVFKSGWAGRLFAAGSDGARSGSPTAEAPEPGSDAEQDGGEVGDSAGGGGAGMAARQQNGPRRPAAEQPPMCGRFSAEVCRAYLQLATTGRPSNKTVDLLRRVSPASVTSNITVPTLLVQGENDTLFGLEHADATARQITAAGGMVDMIWYAGGHDGGTPGPRLRGQIGDWLFHQLTGSGQNPAAGFAYDVQGALRSSGAPSVRKIEARGYPGVSAGAGSRSRIELDGGQQTVLHPPGGEPAAVSGIPGLSGQGRSAARLSELFGVEPPGQSARFRSAPRDGQLLISGASTVRVRVSAAPNIPEAPREPVLFAKLYDIGPDGDRTLPAGAVAPFRLTALPADGTPVEATVTLPAVVHPVEAGHSVELVVGTTDRSYAAPPNAAAYNVALAADRAVHVPVVPGRPAESGWPVGQLLGIAGVLAATGSITLVTGLRRQRASRVRDDLITTPLVIEELTKSYPGGLTAVNALSFRVEAGRVLGLLGPNGAGKTTALRMLMGLVTPSAGSITVFGHRVTPGAPVLSRIGSFVEGAGFLPHLSGDANLRLYWDTTGRPPQHAHLTEALEIAGLGDAAHRKVRTYSQGMRQRLAIAQAMLGLPELLVLDEPTNGLDPPQIHQMREVLRRYAATGRTVVVSSHLLAEVEQTCSHVVVMHRGGLVAAGAVDELTAPGGETTFTVDEPELAAEALRMEFGVSAVDVDGQLVHVDATGAARSEVVAVLVRAGVAVEQAGPRRRLEDAFLRLVGEEAR